MKEQIDQFFIWYLPHLDPDHKAAFKSDLDSLLKEAEHEGYIRGLNDHNPIKQKRRRKPKHGTF